MPESSDEKDKARLLRLVPLNTLPPEVAEQLLQVAEQLNLKKRDVLFEQGDTAHQNVYLLDGRIELLDGERQVEVIEANNPMARFPIAHQLPRRYTARALGKARCVRIDGGALSAALSGSPAGDYQVSELESADEDADWMTQLLQSRVMQQIPPANIQRVMLRMEEMEVSEGEDIITEGDPGFYFYLINRGRAAVLKQVQGEAEPQELARLGPGDSFGEEALLSDAPRGSSVRMLSDGLLLRLSKDDFIELIKRPLAQVLDYPTAVQQVKQGALWLDVRETALFEAGHLPGAINLPFASLRHQAEMLDPAQRYIVCSQDGRRAVAAAYLLTNQELDASILEGGYAAVPASDLRDAGEPSATDQADAAGADAGQLTTRNRELEQRLRNALAKLASSEQLAQKLHRIQSLLRDREERHEADLQRLAAAERQLEDRRQHEAEELGRLKERVTELIAERDLLQLDLQEAQAGIDAGRERLEEQLATLRQQQEQQAHSHEQQQQHHEQTVQQLQQQLQALTDELEQARANCDQQRQQCEQLQGETEQQRRTAEAELAKRDAELAAAQRAVEQEQGKTETLQRQLAEQREMLDAERQHQQEQSEQTRRQLESQQLEQARQQQELQQRLQQAEQQQQALNEQIEQQAKQLDERQQHIETLQQELQQVSAGHSAEQGQWQSERQQHQADLATAQQHLNELKQALDQQQVRQQQAEQALEAEREQRKADADAAATRQAQLQRQLEESQKTLADRDQCLTELNRRQSELQSMATARESELDGLRLELAELRQARDAATEAMLARQAALDSHKQSQQEEQEALQAKLQALTDQLQQAEAQRGQLEQQLSDEQCKMEEQQAAAAREIELLSERLSQATEQAGTSQSELEAARNQSTELQQQLAQLRQQSEQLQQQLQAQQEGSARETGQLRSELVQLQQQADDLAQQLQQQRETGSQDLQQLQAERDELQEKLSALTRDRQDDVDLAEGQKEALQQQIQTLRSELDEAHRRYQQEREQWQQRRAELTDREQEARGALAEAEQELTLLREEQVIGDQSLGDLQKLLAQREQALQQLQDEREQWQQSAQSVHEQGGSMVLTERLTALRSQLRDTERERDKALAETDELRAVMEQYVEQIQAAQEAAESGEGESLRAELKMVREQAEQDVARLRQQLKEANQELANAVEQADSSGALELEALRQEVDALAARLADRERELRQSQDTTQLLEDALEDANTEIDELRRQMERVSDSVDISQPVSQLTESDLHAEPAPAEPLVDDLRDERLLAEPPLQIERVGRSLALHPMLAALAGLLLMLLVLEGISLASGKGELFGYLLAEDAAPAKSQPPAPRAVAPIQR